ncbi:MAG: hypothetical protein IBJ18_08035 [Phycisphaerales bacterium]|nr:hypothetical protein [Phycisphaerales bacterium]
MLRDARDIAAAIAYGKQLDRVRDEQLRRGLTGQPMTDPELVAGEREAVAIIKRDYFNASARGLFLPMNQASAMSDEADFAKRETQLMEEATLDSHRRLTKIPYVGQTGFDDPDPPPPPAPPASEPAASVAVSNRNGGAA